jgi:hypothetical protein
MAESLLQISPRVSSISCNSFRRAFLSQLEEFRDVDLAPWTAASIHGVLQDGLQSHFEVGAVEGRARGGIPGLPDRLYPPRPVPICAMPPGLEDSRLIPSPWPRRTLVRSGWDVSKRVFDLNGLLPAGSALRCASDRIFRGVAPTIRMASRAFLRAGCR